MKDKKVAVIILNWNGRQFLKDCLESVLSQSYGNYLVHFVDNGSTDGSVNFVRKHFGKSKKLKILALDKNYGFAEGNNRGIREALKDKDVKYIIILNNDTTTEGTFLEEFVAGAERHPEAGSFACRIVLYENPQLIDSAGMVLYNNCVPAGRGSGSHVEMYNKEEEIFGAPGAAAMYRRGMLEDVAERSNTNSSAETGEAASLKYYFDPDFFIYQEEFDLSWRAQARGWSCWYIPKAVVRHIGSGTMRKLSQRAKYLLERNRFWALVKNADNSVLWYALPHIIVYELISLPFYFVGGYFSTVLKGRFDALGGLHKMMKKRKEIQGRRNANPHCILKWMQARDYVREFKTTFLGRD